MKKNGKPSESKKTDRERETRVLLERVHSDIQRIAEAQSSTSGQIAEIKTAVDDLLPLKSEVKAISMAVMTLSGDIKALDNKVKVVDNKVDALDGRLKTVEKKLDENLSNHEKRITKLEEKVLI